jgi:ABC-type transport system involved in multi-copper enzyme maturation permease subunit
MTTIDVSPDAPTSITSPTSPSRHIRQDADRGPGPGRLSLSEWTKLRSLRSTWWTLGLAVLVGLGLAWMIAYSLGSADSSEGLAADSVNSVLAGTGFAALILGVLGALQMSGEYTTGTMSVSLTAVPRRWPVLAAKAAVLVAVVAPLALAMSAGALLIGDAVVDGGVAFSWPAILGNTAYVTAVTLLGLGLATLARSTAMSITLLVTAVFVLPPLLPLLPWSWMDTVAEYFPTAAGSSLTTTVPGVASLGDAAAIATLAAWALIPLIAGAVMLTRRDA